MSTLTLRAAGLAVTLSIGVVAASPDPNDRWRSAAPVGVIVGTVVTAPTHEPLAYSTVSIETPHRSQSADARGSFVFADVPPGSVILTAKRIGYAPAVDSVVVVPGDTTRVRIELARLPTQLPPTTTIACGRHGPPTANDTASPTASLRIDTTRLPDRGTRGATPSVATPTSSPGRHGPRVLTIAPAYMGKTSWDLDIDGPLDVGSPGAWTITSQSTFETEAVMWGGGGGGAYSGGGLGGGGGYSMSSLTFQIGVPYTIIVGGGGQGSQVLACGGDGGFGGGGAGGGVQPPGAGTPGMPFLSGGAGQLGIGYLGGAAGGGGGLSGIFRGTTPSQANALMIAGGGGGGTFNGTSGGGGGGLQGEAGAAIAGGAGGDRLRGGAAGKGGAPADSSNMSRPAGLVATPKSCSATPYPAWTTKGLSAADSTAVAYSRSGGSTRGAPGSGGGGGFANGCGAGGGGGGGYFGGGGGGQNRGGGGGGSGFVVTGATTEGQGSMPGNATDPRNGGAGTGASMTGNDGAPGRVIILPPRT